MKYKNIIILVIAMLLTLTACGTVGNGNIATTTTPIAHETTGSEEIQTVPTSNRQDIESAAEESISSTMETVVPSIANEMGYSDASVEAFDKAPVLGSTINTDKLFAYKFIKHSYATKNEDDSYEVNAFTFADYGFVGTVLVHSNENQLLTFNGWVLDVTRTNSYENYAHDIYLRDVDCKEACEDCWIRVGHNSENFWMDAMLHQNTEEGTGDRAHQEFANAISVTPNLVGETLQQEDKCIFAGNMGWYDGSQAATDIVLYISNNIVNTRLVNEKGDELFIRGWTCAEMWYNQDTQNLYQVHLVDSDYVDGAAIYFYQNESGFILSTDGKNIN